MSDPVIGGAMCSTPVGVKDRFTLRDLIYQAGPEKCSTPVGVKDRFTLQVGPVKGPVY